MPKAYAYAPIIAKAKDSDSRFIWSNMVITTRDTRLLAAPEVGVLAGSPI
jgi:hypothetical protein